MNQQNYAENIPNANDFTVAELERPSKDAPVKLAAADDSDFEAGKMATTMGWGGERELLLRVAACGCPVSGVLNWDSCEADFGGPMSDESSTGEDVLVGIVSWSKDDTCGREDYYGVHSRVSTVNELQRYHFQSKQTRS